MKKLAIGCLIVFVLGGVAVVGVGYYGYLRVKSTVSQFAELRKIPEIEAGVRVKSPFIAPKTGALTQDQVDRFMRVQTRVRERLGHNLELLQRNYKSLSDKKDTTVADLPQLMAAYRDMAAGWMDAKRAQVEALNETGLSLDEYRWIRSEAYRALDLPFVDVDWSKIADQVKSGQSSGGVLVGGALTGEASPANVKLVERYRKQLEDNMPMAAFGL